MAALCGRIGRIVAKAGSVYVYTYAADYCVTNQSLAYIITGPPKSALFCSLASVVVRNAAGGRAGRPPASGRSTLKHLVDSECVVLAQGVSTG